MRFLHRTFRIFNTFFDVQHRKDFHDRTDGSIINTEFAQKSLRFMSLLRSMKTRNEILGLQSLDRVAVDKIFIEQLVQS